MRLQLAAFDREGPEHQRATLQELKNAKTSEEMVKVATGPRFDSTRLPFDREQAAAEAHFAMMRNIMNPNLEQRHKAMSNMKRADGSYPGDHRVQK